MSPLLLIALALAIVAGLMVLSAGPGARWGLWHFRTGFSLLRWGGYLALAALPLLIAGMALAWRARRLGGIAIGLVGLLIVLPAVLVPMRWQRVARAAPPIHDITTDTRNPPEFSALVSRRAPTDNPLAYDDPEVPAQQRAAYPDIEPLVLEIPAAQAFERAVDAAVSLGWEVVDTDAATGRIEASHRTRWFGFVDDVAVRVTPLGEQRSLVDVRSVSRIGRGDAGANAARVRAFLERMRG